MKNRRCPNKEMCFGYENDSCGGCPVGDKIIKLNKQIDRLKKRNETLTIQRNAWALAAKAVKEDTVRKMQEKLKEHLEKPEFPWDSFTVAEEVIDQIAKELLEGK